MKVSFIGSGNVGTALASAFFNEGIEIVQIASRSFQNAERLAGLLHTEACLVSELSQDIDVLFICVPDDQIEQVSKQVSNFSCQVHCSGSVPMNVLSSESKGVFYPLQTIRKGQETDFLDVPLLLEASDMNTEIMLDKLASKISNTIRFVNSEDRANYHLAAVFSNNFTNHVLALAHDYCESNGLKFELLRPLITKTLVMAMAENPALLQTGPALRGDNATLLQHQDKLQDNPNAQHLYKVLSESIQSFSKT